MCQDLYSVNQLTVQAWNQTSMVVILSLNQPLWETISMWISYCISLLILPPCRDTFESLYNWFMVQPNCPDSTLWDEPSTCPITSGQYGTEIFHPAQPLQPPPWTVHYKMNFLSSNRLWTVQNRNLSPGAAPETFLPARTVHYKLNLPRPASSPPLPPNSSLLTRTFLCSDCEVKTRI